MPIPGIKPVPIHEATNSQKVTVDNSWSWSRMNTHEQVAQGVEASSWKTFTLNGIDFRVRTTVPSYETPLHQIDSTQKEVGIYKIEDRAVGSQLNSDKNSVGYVLWGNGTAYIKVQPKETSAFYAKISAKCNIGERLANQREVVNVAQLTTTYELEVVPNELFESDTTTPREGTL